jgi:hypothetical protein
MALAFRYKTILQYKSYYIPLDYEAESPSLVLVINDTKLLIPCVKCFEVGISNTCDEGVCGKECGHYITKRWCMDMKC